MMRTDGELAEEYRNGDLTAGDTIVKKYYRHVRNFLWSRCFNKSDVDDITQEAFFKILNMLLNGKVTIDGDKSFKAYCFSIANSVMIDRYRSNANKPLNNKIEPPEDGDQDVFSFVGSDGHTIELELIERQKTIIVNKILSTIDEKYTNILRLAYYEDKTEVEIAKLLNLSLGTVKSRKKIGIRELRDSVITKRFRTELMA